MDKTQLGFAINHVYSKLTEPISIFLKSQRIAALGKAAQGAKDTVGGHRVYLRTMSMLEIELGIQNPENSEVKEGYLNAVGDLLPKSGASQKPASSSADLSRAKDLKSPSDKQDAKENTSGQENA